MPLSKHPSRLPGPPARRWDTGKQLMDPADRAALKRPTRTHRKHRSSVEEEVMVSHAAKFRLLRLPRHPATMTDAKLPGGELCHCNRREINLQSLFCPLQIIQNVFCTVFRNCCVKQCSRLLPALTPEITFSVGRRLASEVY